MSCHSGTLVELFGCFTMEVGLDVFFLHCFLGAVANYDICVCFANGGFEDLCGEIGGGIVVFKFEHALTEDVVSCLTGFIVARFDIKEVNDYSRKEYGGAGSGKMQII